MNTPMLSVIIPVCNVEKYLPECLDSALSQTLEGLEVICVDDGSTDSSGSILDAYAQKDVRVRVLHKTNAGFGQTMNCGLKMATGKYVAFLESDDFIVKEAYAALVVRADECGADIVKADYFEVRGEPNAYQMTPRHMLGRTELYGRNLCPRDVPYLFYVPMMNPMGIFRRDFLQKNRILHNETPGASYQDMGFWFQAFCLAKSVHYMDQSFYCYRKDNPNSSMNNMKKAACVRDEYRFMWQFLERHADLLPWVAPIYYHRLFGSFLFRYNNLTSYLKPRFLMDVFREELIACMARASFSDERFTDSERMKLRQIIEVPDVFLTDSLSKVKINEDLMVAYCKAEQHANAMAHALSLQRGTQAEDSGAESSSVKVSVVVPVYNVAAYLGKCLESLCRQTLKEIEIICVDDGSTDRSHDTLMAFAARDARLRVLTQENCGQSVARNQGLDIAVGKYVYFVDADDWLASDCALEELYVAAERNQTDVLYFDARCVVEDGCHGESGHIGADTYIRKHVYVGCKTGIALLSEFIAYNEYRVSPAMVFLRRRFLIVQNIRFCEGIIYEDNIFSMRCALAAQHALHLPCAYYMRRLHPGSTMTSKPSFKNIYGYLTCYIQLYVLQIKYGHEEAADRAIASQLTACRYQVRRLTAEVKDARTLARRILTPVEYDIYTRMIGVTAARPGAKTSVNIAQAVPRGERESPSSSIFRRGWRCLSDNGFLYTVGNIVGRLSWR